MVTVARNEAHRAPFLACYVMHSGQTLSFTFHEACIAFDLDLMIKFTAAQEKNESTIHHFIRHTTTSFGVVLMHVTKIS